MSAVLAPDRMPATFLDRLRQFEGRLLQRMPELRCAVHLCIGQEVVPNALYAGLRAEDWLFSTHRSHGHYLAKGGSEEKLLAEIEGRKDGVNGGYSGSQSFCDPAINFHSTAVVGGLIGPATGTALALRLSGSSAIVVCCIGDAATEQGVFWESLNFGALHTLPILWVVENNGLSVHAPLRLRQSTKLGWRVQGFGVRYGYGLQWLRTVLSQAGRVFLPAVVEIQVERECNHVSAMEDLRE